MAGVCKNPNCSSCGQPHPNCRCYAEGGAVPAGFTLDAAPEAGDVPAGFQLDEDKFGTVGQQAITALEGAGEGALGPLATGAERALGVPAEDIRARREQNPLSHTAGQIGGFAASALTGEGLAPIAAKAGEALAGITGARGLVGTAVKGATELAAIQAGEEATKMILNDPNQSLQVAAADIGLAAILGGAGAPVFSKAGQLWNKGASGGEKFLDDFVAQFRSRAGLQSEADVANEALPATNPFKKDIFSGSSEAATEESLTPGAKLADALFSHGAKKLSSEALGTSAGAMLGHASGIPGGGTLGAIIGEHALSPAFEATLGTIAKPLMEKLVSEAGVQAAHDFARAVLKGNRLITNTANSVLKVGSTNALSDLEPKDTDIEKLDKQLTFFGKNPDAMLDVGGNLGHYLPGAAAATGEVSARAVQFLNSQRPKESSGLPFDAVTQPTPAQNAQWKRTLQIAQQPLVAMKYLNDGRLNHTDLQTLGTLYPQAYAKMREQLTASLIDAKSQGIKVPYAKRTALALFLGEPLDSTMTPQGIQFIQSTFAQSAQQPAPGPKKSTQKLGKIAEQTATADQQREKSAQKA